MSRRNAIRAGAGLTLGALWSPGARSQAYPARPVRILVGFGVGGNGDVTIRVVADKMASRLGQPWVIENRPSAGGVIASQSLLQSPPDGYTLMLAASSNVAMAPSLFNSLSFDPAKDFAPGGLVSRFGFLLAVNSSSGIRSVADLIAQAKARPGALNIGTTAVGAAQYIGTELLKAVAGIDIVPVPFKTSGDAAVALRSNHVQVIFDNIPPLMPHFQSGALRPIAMTSAERFPGLPDVPTVLESGLRYEFGSWNGLVAPRGTPDEVLELLNRELRSVVQLPDVVEKFRALGAVPATVSRAEFQRFIEDEIVFWRKTLDIARIPKT